MTIAVVIPAAGVGQRMQADRPKQYLELFGQTILEHTVQRLRQVPELGPVWLALAKDDPYFAATPLALRSDVHRVTGGSERADSVLAALMAIDANKYPWVLVHDAARPLVQVADIQKLIKRCLDSGCGGILATPVRDTMKRSMGTLENTQVLHTVERAALWHALTPQLFPTAQLKEILQQALQSGAVVTDEASALEWAGLPVLLVSGRADNIKITQSEDLLLARFYLEQQ